MKKNAPWSHLYGWEVRIPYSPGGRNQLPECPPLFTERDNEIRCAGWGGVGG